MKRRSSICPAAGGGVDNLTLTPRPPLPIMTTPALLIDPRDTLAVALRPLASGEAVELGGRRVRLAEAVPQKQKLALSLLAEVESACEGCAEE